jgi:beta-glucanase (GH16 family)
MGSAELYTVKGYPYGRFEARMLHAAGDGVVSAFFLWKDGSEAAGAFWNEIDFEKVGTDCVMQTNARYGVSGTNHPQMNRSLSNTCTEYHDYRIEWTPTYIAWAVDGNEFRRETGYAVPAFNDNVKDGLQIRFNIWPGNANFGGNIKNTTLPVHQYISWVEYSSFADGNFKVEWREEFKGTGVPDGWTVGNWGSPYNLSTHSPTNVSFVDGIAALSLTTDEATGQPVTPPVDDGIRRDPGTGGGTSGVSSTGGSSGSGKGGSGGCTLAPLRSNAGIALLGMLMLADWLRVVRRGRPSR